jgi:DNA-binding transcriptional regulator YiaG
VSQSQFAALLGVHLVTVKKWETGAQGLRTTAARLIRLLLAQHLPTSGKPLTRPKRRKRGG